MTSWHAWMKSERLRAGGRHAVSLAAQGVEHSRAPHWLIGLALGLAIGVALSLTACDRHADPGAARLPALGLPTGDISVAGISSGGYMAGQLHLAHADRISGAAILAAGPWRCAEGRMQQALNLCISADEADIDIDALVEQARNAAQAQHIAPVAALSGDRVWIFRGTRDTVAGAGVTRALAQFYRRLAPEAHVTLSEDVDATHAWPTVDFGTACEGLEVPYLAACGFDAAGTLLAALRGELAAPREGAGRLLRFDQREFWPASTAHSLHPAGWLFVPAQCSEAPLSCRLLVVLHGCRQSEDFVDEAFVRHTGLNEWAAGNDLVVLYPQVQTSTVRPMNPLGCWDWWGYSGDDYTQRSAPQIRAVMAMVERLGQPPL